MATNNLFNPTTYYYGFLFLLLLASLTVIGIGSSKHEPCKTKTGIETGSKCISKEGQRIMFYGAIAFAIVFILIVVSILGNDPVLRWFKTLYPKTPTGYVERPRVPDVRYNTDDWEMDSIK